jgi:hypothetical protein
MRIARMAGRILLHSSLASLVATTAVRLFDLQAMEINAMLAQKLVYRWNLGSKSVDRSSSCRLKRSTYPPRAALRTESSHSLLCLRQHSVQYVSSATSQR